MRGHQREGQDFGGGGGGGGDVTKVATFGLHMMLLLGGL